MDLFLNGIWSCEGSCQGRSGASTAPTWSSPVIIFMKHPQAVVAGAMNIIICLGADWPVALMLSIPVVCSSRVLCMQVHALVHHYPFMERVWRVAGLDVVW